MVLQKTPARAKIWGYAEEVFNSKMKDIVDICDMPIRHLKVPHLIVATFALSGPLT